MSTDSNRSTSFPTSSSTSLPPHHPPPYAVPPLHPAWTPPPPPHPAWPPPPPPLLRCSPLAAAPNPDPRHHSPLPVPIRAATVSPVILFLTPHCLLLSHSPAAPASRPLCLSSDSFRHHHCRPLLAPPLASGSLPLFRVAASAPIASRSRSATHPPAPSLLAYGSEIERPPDSPPSHPLPPLSISLISQSLPSLFPSLRQRDRVESPSSSSASPGVAQEGGEASRLGRLPHIPGHSPIVFLSGFPRGGVAATPRLSPSSSPSHLSLLASDPDEVFPSDVGVPVAVHCSPLCVGAEEDVALWIPYLS